MWERFSYYGMRAFLILYLVAPVALAAWASDPVAAASVYGTYTGSAWGAAILGGFVADRLLGQFNAVLVGGSIIALGHFTLAFKALPAFYAGLALIALGTGLLKPNVSTMVGSLYEQGDRRRDAGFSIFYMGINSGGLFGQIVAGYLAQTSGLARRLRLRRVRHGVRPGAVLGGPRAACSTASTGSRRIEATRGRRSPRTSASPSDSAARNGRGSSRSSSSSCSRRCSGAPTSRPDRR